ncbi:MAG: di-trans,poly-cis-decaprenylcistransferase, partial [Gammaproteobacteria bacterium]|nr:di-trans,poly-cis-decaprenylcistransferase [Gammaproteobacteria bacterium]
MHGKLRHLAIVMDGNGRWAHRSGLARSVGHRQGMEATLRIIEAAAERDIEYLSLFALSCENMSRPQSELIGIESLISAAASRFRQIRDKRGIRLRVIGDLSALSRPTRDLLEDLVRDTPETPPRLHLQVAVNYSGQWDIMQAVNKLCARATTNSLASASPGNPANASLGNSASASPNGSTTASPDTSATTNCLARSIAPKTASSTAVKSSCASSASPSRCAFKSALFGQHKAKPIAPAIS